MKSEDVGDRLDWLEDAYFRLSDAQTKLGNSIHNVLNDKVLEAIDSSNLNQEVMSLFAKASYYYTESLNKAVATAKKEIDFYLEQKLKKVDEKLREYELL
jgi:hypothetical protein